MNEMGLFMKRLIKLISKKIKLNSTLNGYGRFKIVEQVQIKKDEQDMSIEGINFINMKFSLDPELWHETFLNVMTFSLKPTNCIEVGVSKGRTTKILSANCSNVYAIDIDPSASFYIDKLNNVSFINEESRYALAGLLPKLRNEVDFIFVDGDHRADTVMLDVEISLQLLSDTGLLVLHDTYPKDYSFISERNEWCGDSYKVPKLIQNKFKEVRLVTLPIHPGLTIVQKIFSQPHWMNPSKA
jgi:predicted O-methyltransferase YrrM